MEINYLQPLPPKTKKTRVKDNVDGGGLLFLSYNFIVGDLCLLFLQTCKGITFIEKFDLTNNVYLMSDKDILCESLSTLLQYTQYFDSMRSNSPSKNQIRFLQIFQLS